MDQPPEQKKTLHVSPDRTRASKAQKYLLVAFITAGILLATNLLSILHHQDSKLTFPRMAKAATVQVIIDQAIAPPTKTSAQTSAPSVKSPAEISGDELYQKCMFALINRQFQDAINCFSELQTSNPEMLDKIDLPYAEALLGLAENLRKSDPQQAIALFQQAIQIDPRSVRAHFQLGMALTRQKDYAAAIVSYQRAIELDPQFPDTFFNLGFLYAASKNYVGAVEMYTRTVALQPDYLDEALFNLALAQSKQDKKEQSLANLKKALLVNPDNKTAHNYLKQLQGGSEE
jgi:tetratricopeptide (TPR) repeat protein